MKDNCQIVYKCRMFHFRIYIVRIPDIKLAEEYSFHEEQLPTLAYFRYKVPMVYNGEFGNTEEVFEFLFQNRFLPDMEQRGVEEVQDGEKLEILFEHIDSLLVTFDGFNNDDLVQEALEIVAAGAREKGVSVIRTKSENAKEVRLFYILREVSCFMLSFFFSVWFDPGDCEAARVLQHGDSYLLQGTYRRGRDCGLDSKPPGKRRN